MSSTDRLLVLDMKYRRVLSVRTDGTDVVDLVTGLDAFPDGIAIDPAAGYMYWTNMGHDFNANDGFISRARLDGSEQTVLFPPGSTFTPKQITLHDGLLYWGDREGMRVLRGPVDGMIDGPLDGARGTAVEVLVEAGKGDDDRQDARHWCVGVAVDPVERKLYWSQKGPDDGDAGRILRAGLDLPGDPAHRDDVEVLYHGLPEPIDLELDLAGGLLYWTDRGAGPRGNTLNRAPIPAYGTQGAPSEILFSGLHEGIGVALDPSGEQAFVTDLGGDLWAVGVDGSAPRRLLHGAGVFTGIAYLPTA
ncbi:hypothetical protein GCM10027589_14870 [Actinocorallia lasiicapitis]